jgi:hypothetical protein
MKNMGNVKNAGDVMNVGNVEICRCGEFSFNMMSGQYGEDKFNF